jgi:hypothetical protein
MEPKMKNTGIRSGGNGKWAVAPGADVAITFLGLYYVGRGVISKILCRDPLLVEVKIIEVSPAIEVEIPFPVLWCSVQGAFKDTRRAADSNT